MLMLKLRLASSSSSSPCGGGLLQLLRLSTAATAASSQASPPPLVAFLVEELGFSLEKATKISSFKDLAHLQSLDKPKSAVGFMRSIGFSDADIGKIASCQPRYLVLDAQKTLAPKFQSLKELGFSEPEIAQLLYCNQRTVFLDFQRTLIPRIRFWQSLLGSRERLVRLAKDNICNFLSRSVDRVVLPNVLFLRSCGISDERIALTVRRNPRLVAVKPQLLVSTVDRVEKEMGVSRSSGMFHMALAALHGVSKDKFNAIVKLMTGFGWSKADFLTAFRKAPAFLKASLENLDRKMKYLIEEAGLQPSDVANYPVLLMLSLDKRVIPRHHIIKILMSRGLLTKNFNSIMTYSDEVFLDRVITPYRHIVPDLEKIYMDACGKGVAL